MDSSNLGSEWKILTGTYQLHKIIGRGTFGTVVSGKNREFGTKVAIKQIKNYKNSTY
jgi:serine/threonine protein kinase